MKFVWNYRCLGLIPKARLVLCMSMQIWYLPHISSAIPSLLSCSSGKACEASNLHISLEAFITCYIMFISVLLPMCIIATQICAPFAAPHCSPNGSALSHPDELHFAGPMLRALDIHVQVSAHHPQPIVTMQRSHVLTAWKNSWKVKLGMCMSLANYCIKMDCNPLSLRPGFLNKLNMWSHEAAHITHCIQFIN